MLKDIVKSFFHPKELQAIFSLKYSQASLQSSYSTKTISEISKLDKSEFCYAILHKVSRSFAAVIQQLPDEIRDAICIFYLVLRGLDSIEDDMNLPAEEKKQLLSERKRPVYRHWLHIPACNARSDEYRSTAAF